MIETVRNSTLAVRIVAVAVAVAFALSLAGAATTTYALTQADIDVICAIVGCDADQEAALNALVSGGSTGGSCPVLTQPLTLGSQGQAVTNLQTYLQGTGHFTFSGGATGYFGPITQSAVAAWQAANGVSPAVGYFGSISLAKYNMVCTSGTITPPPPGTPPTTGGTEGGIVVTQEGSPSNGTDVDEGETKVVSAFEIDADDDSVMTLNRVDVSFGHRPWLYLEAVALYCDGDLLKEMDGLSSSDFTEITSGSDYRWRASGLNHVIPAGEEQRCEVEVTAILDSEKTDTTITITHGVDSVRASDTTGLQHEEPTTAFTRTFDFQDETAANLNWTLHSSEPDDAIVVDVSDTGTTNNVVLCEFQVEAEQQDAFLNGLQIDFGGQGSDIATVFTQVRLEDDDGNVIETATTVSTTTNITGFDPDVELPQDEKVHLRIVAEVKDADDFAAGSAASTTIDASETDAEDAGFDDITSLGSDITCEDRHFYEDAPIFTLVSSNIVGVDDGAGSVKSANAEIKVKVTAQDVDVYLLDFANGGWIASTTPANFGTTTGDFTAVGGSAAQSVSWKILAGQSRDFIFTANTDNTTSGDGDGFVKIDTASFTYNTSNAVAGATTFTFGIEDFETKTIFLND